MLYSIVKKKIRYLIVYTTCTKLLKRWKSLHLFLLLIYLCEIKKNNKKNAPGGGKRGVSPPKEKIKNNRFFTIPINYIRIFILVVLPFEKNIVTKMYQFRGGVVEETRIIYYIMRPKRGLYVFFTCTIIRFVSPVNNR